MGRWYKGEVSLNSGVQWALTPGKEYYISEYGDVVNAKTGYKLNPARSKSTGYLMVKLDKSDNVKTINSVHQSVYSAFVGPIPDGMVINHIDGVKDNNHISNLELCTYSENSIHAHKIGLSKGLPGELNGMSKITEKDVHLIYDLINTGYSNKGIAVMFNIDDKYVSLIRHGKRWSHIYETRSVNKGKSLGNLPYPLPKCVWIYNKCLLSSDSQKDLSKELGIDPSTVSRIRTGKSWVTFREYFGIPKNTGNWKDIRSALTVDI